MADTRITPQSLTLRIGVIIFSVLQSRAGKLEIRRIDSPVDTLLGHNTTLPCHFSGYEASYLDFSKVSVRWTLRTLKEEKPVYLFAGGRHIQNRPGSDIPDNELLGGDGSLHIPNVQFSDEGEYICTVIITPDEATSKVTLQVLVQPACTVSDSRLEMNPESERSVTCYVNDFYPQAVTIHWLKNIKASSKKSKLDSQACTSIPVQNQDGTYNVTSVLFVKPMSTDEDGDIYSCIITHRSLIDGLTCNVTLSVQPKDNIPLIILSVLMTFSILLLCGGFIRSLFIIYIMKEPPKVLDFVGPELIHEKRSELTCDIVYFRPKNIDIILYLNRDNEDIEQDRWNSTRTKSDQDIPLLHHSLVFKPSIKTAKNGVSSCICSVYITPDFCQHNGAKLILEVRHKALKDPVRKEMMLKVKAAPVFDPIEANQESYNVGDHLELTCKIHSFHPRYINRYKEEESFPSSNNEALEDENGFFSVTSRVTHTVTEEDYGKIFRCKVEHPDTTDKDKVVTWKLQRQGD